MLVLHQLDLLQTIVKALVYQELPAVSLSQPLNLKDNNFVSAILSS